jgi:hypothetical protein
MSEINTGVSQIDERDVVVLEMLAGLTERVTQPLVTSLGNVSIDGISAQNPETIAVQAALLERIGNAYLRIASAVGSTAIQQRPTDAVSDTPAVAEPPIQTEINAISLVPFSEPEETEKCENSRDTEEGMSLIPLEIEVLEFAKKNDFFRSEEIRRISPGIKALTEEEYTEFKKIFPQIRERISKYLNDNGIAANWETEGQRRGQKYRLVTEGSQATSESLNVTSDIEAPPEKKEGFRISTVVINRAQVTAQRQNDEQRLLERNITRFETIMARWVEQELSLTQGQVIKQSELSKRIETGLGISQEASRLVIRNLIEAELVHRGRPEKGQATLALKPKCEDVDGRASSDKEIEKKERIVWTEDLMPLAIKLIGFVNSERHLELGQKIEDIKAFIDNQDIEYDERTVRFTLRRLAEFNILEEKQNARVSAKKRGRRSSSNVKTTRYMMKNGETRKLWVSNPDEILDTIRSKADAQNSELATI